MGCIAQRAVAKRSRRGIVLVLAAMFLAIAAMALALAIDSSQKFLSWKQLRTRAEAAALAAALELDGTPESAGRARQAAIAISALLPEQVEARPVGPSGIVIRLTNGGLAVAAAAHQQERRDPEVPSGQSIRMIAPEPERPGFGLFRGSRYTASGTAAAGAIVPIQVHSGFPKEIPLTWIAGRVVESTSGGILVENLGGYLRGSTRAAADNGWFEVELGPAPEVK